tara:strand:- start:233 stop:481 length:249 start_codon:yes stop_codon:yes gene_type:complete
MTNEIPEEIKQKIDDLHNKSEFVVSWFAKKYKKTIFRLGTLNKEGCRTWEKGGKKYMCFWDVVIERYTTCIDPMITYKKVRN